MYDRVINNQGNVTSTDGITYFFGAACLKPKLGINLRFLEFFFCFILFFCFFVFVYSLFIISHGVFILECVCMSKKDGGKGGLGVRV